MSGNTIPPFLNRIELEVLIAGRKFTQSFQPAINLDYTFVWDGRDAYGRLSSRSTWRHHTNRLCLQYGLCAAAKHDSELWLFQAGFASPGISLRVKR